jgi:hypothetical protein
MAHRHYLLPTRAMATITTTVVGGPASPLLHMPPPPPGSRKSPTSAHVPIVVGLRPWQVLLFIGVSLSVSPVARVDSRTQRT